MSIVNMCIFSKLDLDEKYYVEVSRYVTINRNLQPLASMSLGVVALPIN